MYMFFLFVVGDVLFGWGMYVYCFDIDEGVVCFICGDS